MIGPVGYVELEIEVVDVVQVQMVLGTEVGVGQAPQV